ncbi:MAG: CpsD/CapB family tyrosine-protein kinase, partial [Chlamydiota bacterium]|nr:CpsD/CapB family tyrosine-protein kinase [Chlamydiota bacterium]
MGHTLDVLVKNAEHLSGVEGSIASAAEKKHIHTILVSSSHEKEGKTTSAVMLAYALAVQSDAKVLLVDGNISAPAISELFQVSPSPGLTDFLSQDKDFSAVIKKTSYKNLSIMTYGTASSSVRDFFRNEIFKNKLDALRQAFDYVIVDGPSILKSSEISLIAACFDGTVVVVECQKTR